MIIFRRVLIGFFSLCCLLVVIGLWAWNGHLPKFEWALNRAILKLVVASPEILTQVHIFDPFSKFIRQDKLDDISLASGDKTLNRLTNSLAELHSYKRSDLNQHQQLSYDMAEWLLQNLVSLAGPWRYYNYPVNPLLGVQTNFLTLMDSTHHVDTIYLAQDYNARLANARIKFAQALDGVKKREQLGVIPPTFVVRKLLIELNAFVAKPVEGCVLYTSFKTKLEKTDIPVADQKRLLNDARTQIQTVVYPAYQSLIDYFTQLEPKTNQDAGVWKFPDGDAFYARALAFFTTSDMTPQQIHELGLQEVARVQKEMQTILVEQGYDISLPVGTLMQKISNEERFLYPDTDAGREQMLSDYRAIILNVTAAMPKWFNETAKAKLRVEAVPAYIAVNAPRAYYNGGAIGSSQDGVFYANLYEIKVTPKFDMKTLAYHEAVPGHHLQYSVAQQEPDLPLFRRAGAFIAYVEGWALYVERWAHEAGFENDPYENLGRLNAELFRAARLVVDTGIHKFHWSREQAIDYLKATTGKNDSEVEAEIDRYILMPGQACAYTVGMIEILNLRELAKQKLGSKFDIREFHSVILKNGAMPLNLLEQVVKRWIEDTLARS